MAERLVVEDVVKVYPGGNTALKGPSFTVEPGTFMVLLGPSGSGKTTLLRSLAGIERITSGTIVIGDVVVAADRVHLPPDRRDLSMVFQDYALWPHLSVRDNVAFALRRRGHPRRTCQEMAVAMIGRVGLGHLAARFPGELSGGEQQRVALARALVADTGLLLCDEPLSNLDADLRERMRVEISSLVREVGATTIYITHDQLEAFALADQVGVLEQGRLVQLGTPEEIYRSPATAFVARFTGLAGELPVRVHQTAGPSITVEPTGLPSRRPVEARSAVAPGGGAGGGGSGAASGNGNGAGHADGRGLPGGGATGGDAGSHALLAIRPTAVTLCEPHDERAHFAGIVADVAFRGRNYELAVDLEGGGQLRGVSFDRRVPRGSAVGVELDPAGCLVFPAEGTGIGTVEDPAAGDPTSPGGAGIGVGTASGAPA